MSYSCFDEQPDLVLDELDYEETKDGIIMKKQKMASLLISLFLMIITKILMSTSNLSTITMKTMFAPTKW